MSEKEKLKNALENGTGFEDTKEGKKLGFKEDEIKLYVLMKKNNFLHPLKGIRRALEKEEYEFNCIKENLEENQEEIREFVKENLNIPKPSTIRTSEVRKALMEYSSKATEPEYRRKYVWLKNCISIMRSEEFGIEERLNSDVKTIIGNNQKVAEYMTEELAELISKRDLDLADILSVSPIKTTLEYDNRQMQAELNYHYANEAAADDDIKEGLEEATRINFPVELKTYIEAFDFRYRKNSYEDFHKMLTKFALENRLVEIEPKWESWEALKNDSEGELLESQNERKKEEDYYENVKYVVRKIGEDVYSAKIKLSGDCEGENYSEVWYKNGEKHRTGGLPAVKTYSRHKILEETHMDDASQEFWKDGEMQYVNDTTYEDVLVKKPLAARQSIGCDVDEDSENQSFEEEISYSQQKYIEKKVNKYKEKNGLDGVKKNNNNVRKLR